MREETARLASEVLATIDSSENGVHQRTLNRLTTFIDSFRSLNFAGDQQLEQKLERFRRDLLTRTAEDYRAEAEIASVCTSLKRHGRRPTDYDTVVLARACEQFTGAEIEAVFIDAMHEAYAEGKEPGPKEILQAMTNTVPLAQLMDGQIAALRHGARGRAREAAARTTPARNGRRMCEAN
jgi:SpoVK/Ycf46/Vps4 family AAA+-type ATPase